jgi:hypothetical protein
MRGDGVKRWMIVAAMGLAAAGGIATSGTARASSTAWYQVYQSGFSGNFDQIAAISPSNIWAVGTADNAAGTFVYQPFIRHFNGTGWQAVTIPGATGSTSDWVTASAGNDVWVGGLKNSGVATTVAYHWNGAHWGKVPMPAMTAIGDVVALAPNNVWAVGNSGTLPYDVFHWNGTKWQGYLIDTLNFVAQGLSASSASNIWVSGYSYSGSKQVAAAYQWNGTSWHAVSMPHPVLYAGGPDVTAVSPANVWIGYVTSSTSPNYFLHWDGHTWHTLTGAYYSSTDNIVPDGKGGYWFGAQVILTGSTWTDEQVPAFSGGYSFVVRIPGTTSFLLPASVETSSGVQKPTIFRFNL